jgi:hypothetical protein
MGVQRVVTFPTGEPTWPAVAAKLAETGESPPIRMIDGLPAFPDEQPEDGWRELRLGFAAGMVTVARGPGGWRFTVWGTEDPALLRAQEVTVNAAAAAGGGVVSE